MTQSLDISLTLQRAQFSLRCNLQLPDNGVTVLFGHSGSGKTTLLRCIAGLERGSGQIRFRDSLWQDKTTFIPTWKRPLSCVFQESSLFPHLSAADNLDYARKRASQPINDQQQNDIIELLGIAHTLSRKPNALSGGERQRVAIARALLNNPQLLLMDEPLAALDQQRKAEILPYLKELKHSLQVPIIYVTHSNEELALLADYLVLMENGQVTAAGAPDQTLTRLDTPFASEQEAGVIIDGFVLEQDEQWQLQRISCGHGALWLRSGQSPVGSRVRARILARDVSLSLSTIDDSSIANCVPCEVEEVGNDSHPGLSLVRVRSGNAALLSRMTRRSAHQLKLTPGQQVWAHIKSAAILSAM